MQDIRSVLNYTLLCSSETSVMTNMHVKLTTKISIRIPFFNANCFLECTQTKITELVRDSYRYHL